MNKLITLLAIITLSSPIYTFAETGSGQATGKRQHKPVTILKPVELIPADKVTPTATKKEEEKPTKPTTIRSSVGGAAGSGKAN